MTAVLGFSISRWNKEISKQYLLAGYLRLAPAERLSHGHYLLRTKGQSGPVGAELGAQSCLVQSEVCLRSPDSGLTRHSTDPLDEGSQSRTPEPTQHKAGGAQGCTAEHRQEGFSLCLPWKPSPFSLGKGRRKGETHIWVLTSVEI